MKRLLKLSTFALATIIALSFTNNSFAQENVKPIRVGLKFGTPGIVGLNLEYVTPVLGNKLSANLDLSSFTLSAGDAEVKFSSFAIGANYYFFKPGRGLYGGLGYGRLAFSASQTLSSTSNGVPISAKGEGSLAYNNLNLKIGGKHGGLFYFRWELGYGVTLSGGDLVISADASAPGVEPVHLEETINVPLSGLPIMNIGFGFSF